MYPDLWVHLPSGCTSGCFPAQAFWRRGEEEYISSSLSLVEGDLHRASHAPELSGRARGALSISWETLGPEINKVWGAHTRHSSTSLCPWDNHGWRSYKRKQQGGEAGPGTIGQRHLSRSVGGPVWHMKPPNSHRCVINVCHKCVIYGKFQNLQVTRKLRDYSTTWPGSPFCSIPERAIQNRNTSAPWGRPSAAPGCDNGKPLHPQPSPCRPLDLEWGNSSASSQSFKCFQSILF